MILSKQEKLIAAVIPAEAGIQSYRHCEERSDAAISCKSKGYNVQRPYLHASSR